MPILQKILQIAHDPLAHLPARTVAFSLLLLFSFIGFLLYFVPVIEKRTENPGRVQLSTTFDIRFVPPAPTQRIGGYSAGAVPVPTLPLFTSRY